ncbi:MAG: gliding motility-associated peptidyl-prolyl isomerase GldI [Flavobacteriaceae bacterium]
MIKYLVFVIAIFTVGCKEPEARRPITVQSGTFINESVARNKALNEKENALINNYIKQQNSTYITSENGFWYTYDAKIETDTLPTPKFGDVVTYNCSIKTLNGNIIYSEEDLKTQTYTIDQEELFTGLREGLKLMKPGETVTFLFPSQKAYGYYGDDNKIDTNTPIICQVTLNTITKSNTQ